MEELKPCPFCGGKPDYHKSIDRYYWAICHNCGINIADKKSGETIKLWNHRPDEARLQKRIEELENAVRFFCTEEVGLSSTSIVMHMTGHGISEYYPYDPADFRRCLLLLDAVPGWAGRIVEMREVSIEWKRLIEHWSEITEIFKTEVPNYKNQNAYWDAPKTFELMQKVLKGADND